MLRSSLLLAAMVAAVELEAQDSTLAPRRWSFGVATGPTFFYGEEGNTVGLNFESQLARRLGTGRTWLRADFSTHGFGAQRLYPCSLSLQSTCFTTSQRMVVGGGISLQHAVGRENKDAARGSPFFTLGVATLISARVAEKIQECSPSGLCPAEPITHNMTNTDYGVTVGAGQLWNAGRRQFFVETRLLQPLTKQVGSLTRFRLMPLSFGMRF
ncbi:MAG: hypothetical protein ABIS29_00775 [Vicinamibacterales bacterium]